MKTIIFAPTWRCNLKCSYCDYRVTATGISGAGSYRAEIFGIERIIENELTWQQWLALLDRFRPYHLECTGGDPTMYPHLPQLIANLPADCTWAITSNTLFTKAIEEMPTRGCLCWTASYHYRDSETFLGNLYTIASKGITPKVTLVITPENYETSLHAIDWIKSKGFQVNIHPAMKSGNPWEGKDELWNRVQNLQGVNVVRCITKDWPEKRFKSCIAGSEYFLATPDGKAARCYTQYINGIEAAPIESFKPTEGLQPCGMSCMLPCDLNQKKGQ